MSEISQECHSLFANNYMPFLCLSKIFFFFFFGMQNQSTNLQDLSLVAQFVKNLRAMRETLV